MAISPILTQTSILTGSNLSGVVIGPFAGYLLGLFAVNWLHEVAHLAIGIAGLAVFRNPVAARSYALALGVLYALLFLLRLILPTVFGLLPPGGAPDIIRHLLTALLAFGTYLASRGEAPSTASPHV